MAIRSGGPPKPPDGPNRAEGPAERKVPGDSHKPERSSLDTPEPKSPEHLPSGAPSRGSEQLSARALMSLGAQLTALEPEAERLFALLAAQGFSGPILESTSRLRSKLDELRRRLAKLRRAQRESETGLARVPESEIGAWMDQLEEIAGLSTQWAKSLAGLDLATRVDSDRGPRRLVLRGSDRQEAMAHVEVSNLSTALADLSASAMSICAGAHEAASDDSKPLGRTLDAERRLAELIAFPIGTND